MLLISQLVKRFREREVLRGVSLGLEPGKVGVLIGPSGSGKSTILRCINGLETFESGEIAVAGGRITGGMSYHNAAGTTGADPPPCGNGLSAVQSLSS